MIRFNEAAVAPAAEDGTWRNFYQGLPSRFNEAAAVPPRKILDAMKQNVMPVTLQ
jgi:hypothetical protein